MKTINHAIFLKATFSGLLFTLILPLTLYAVPAKPVISRQPAGATYSANATARFYVNAHSIDGGYLTYQWYCSQPFNAPVSSGDPTADIAAIKNNATSLPEGVAATLTTTTPTVSTTTYYYYWVKITNTKDGDSDFIESAVAQAKIVDRRLLTSLQKGDFEAYNAAIMLRPDGYWNTTHEGSLSGNAGAGKMIEINTAHAFILNGSSSKTAELSGYESSSIYQEVATIPGKIYEWSLDHASKNNQYTTTLLNVPDVVAIVIGTAINEDSDYANMGVTNYWNKVNASTFVKPEYTTSQPGGDYNYGVNMYTHFNAIVNQVLTEQNITAADYNANKGSTFNDIDRIYTTTYGGKLYYVFISADLRDTYFSRRVGVYTVPSGQGTTVFSFVSVSSPGGGASGNILDNIVFASGSPLALTPTITYGNDVSLSVPTKVGYTYGIAEVRGSSVSLVPGATAYYDPDGTGSSPEVAISKTAGLGIDGWYSTYGTDSPFTAAGVITFKNLTPGKTYRIVGIPILAVNDGLHVNETPEYVLDEGYYKDIQIEPAYNGSDTIIWNVDVDTYIDTDGVTKRARVIVKNARTDVEYALLADASGDPSTTEPAHVYTDWIPGTDGLATFNNLKLDTYYYLVARPYGYEEITYADAAYDVDGTTPKYIKIKTPGSVVTDIDKTDVSRSFDCLSITLSNSKNGYTYAVVEPETGVIIGSPQDGSNGSPLTFTVPNASKTYQIVTKSGDANWLRGVRVYACCDNFFIDYFNELVKSYHDASGNIPTDIEYNIRSKDTGEAWILGDDDVWITGIGTQPIDLSTKILAGNTKSILDSITSFDNDATLYYRFNINPDGYTGQWINPVKETVIPKRPNAPETTVNYNFNYFDEKITVVSDSLHFAQINTSQWTSLLHNSDWTFVDAGWGEGVSPRPFNVRIPATDTSFASTVRRDTIPSRPAAPVVGLQSNDDISKVVITNMIDGIAYQYTTDLSLSWVDYTPNGTTKSDSIPFTSASTCYVRLSATGSAPASFITVLSSPVSVQPIHFANYVYGDTPVPAKVVVISSISVPVDIDSIKLHGTNSEYYHFVNIPDGDDKKVPANKSNTNWVLIPNDGLDAGNYNTKLKMTYTYNVNDYEAYADVYLTVEKTQWNLTNIKGEFDVSQTRAQQLVLNIVDAPVGAHLSYYYGSTPVAGNPKSTVDANGEAAYTFTDDNGLQPSTTYSVGVQAQEDKNHYASSIVPLATGYTAYATPVFDDVIAIDYINERLTFKSGYLSGDYTLGCSSCNGAPVIASPYSLYNILEDVKNNSIEFSIIHNAGVSPPYPASEAGYSGTVQGRPDAPTVDYNTAKPASSSASYDGEIHIAGDFQYCIHGATGWNSASNSVTALGVGDYDARYSATDTTFASRQVMVTVSTIVSQPVSVSVVACCIHDTLSVEIPPTANTVNYQWYSNTSNSTSGGTPVTGAIESRFPVPTELTVGTHYYYCVINIANSSSLVSGVATVTVISTPKHITSVSPSATCLGGYISLNFSGTSPHEVFYTITDGSSVTEYSFVATASDTAIVANTVGKYTFKNMLDGYVCTCTAVFTVQVNTKVNSGVIGDDQTICYNSVPNELTSTTDATGGSSGTYTYQWIESVDNGATWTDISGATSKDYSPPALTATTLYRLVTSDVAGGSACNIDSSNIVTVTVRSIALSNYPDIRLSVCRDAGTSVNLSRYIDSLGVTGIQWNSLSGIPITPTEGVISMDNLPIAGVYSFTYTVSNICKSDVKRKVYLEVLNNRIVRQLKDTVVMCYLYADAVNINRLFGIEAGGEWTYSSVPSGVEIYVRQSTSSVYGGAVVMDGKSFYETGTPSSYHGVAAKMVKFSYKTHTNSCLHGEEYDMVIVLTEDMFK